MSWQLQFQPSVIGTGVHMPEALISGHDRDSLVEIALPFWSFHSCHFSSGFRNVARCCTLHPVSAYAVPGWHQDRETIFQGYKEWKWKEGDTETSNLSKIPFLLSHCTSSDNFLWCTLHSANDFYLLLVTENTCFITDQFRNAGKLSCNSTHWGTKIFQEEKQPH